MSTPVRLMGDLGGWPVWLDDYESGGPCGATLPANWPMLSESLKADLIEWNLAWISDTPSELAIRLQRELGNQYDVQLDL
jgi:hypothetical protein